MMKIRASARHVSKKVEHGLILHVQGVGTISHTEHEDGLVRLYLGKSTHSMIQLREEDPIQVWYDPVR